MQDLLANFREIQGKHAQAKVPIREKTGDAQEKRENTNIWIVVHSADQ